MTLFDKLKAHIGGLVLLKTELYWYKAGKWDEPAERVYLLLDTLTFLPAAAAVASTPADGIEPSVAVLLFIDGTPDWVWVYSSTVELLK